jgi:hypothetical protein
MSRPISPIARSSAFAAANAEADRLRVADQHLSIEPYALDLVKSSPRKGRASPACNSSGRSPASIYDAHFFRVVASAKSPEAV